MFLTREQVREVDRRAAEEFGLPSLVLMENAGRSAAELLMKLNPGQRPTLILCGKGNNGGDGLVIARHLDNHGWPVQVHLFADPNGLKGDAAVNCQVALRSQVPVAAHPGRVLDGYLAGQFRSFEGWFVDALFGTGLTGPLREPFDQVVAAVNASPAWVLAVDIPSGLDCDTGEPLGPTVRAHHTVTFVAPKAGFANPEARHWTGEVHVAEIGAPRRLLEEYGVERMELQG
jgi:NAD(P)H-hydrate epimerase